jgi:hypothetical protein
MTAPALDLWTLTRGRPQIDPRDLAQAVARQVVAEPLDYRTRLLIRDSVNALRQCWGEPRVRAWLEGCAQRDKIEDIAREPFDEVGFPSLPRRLMEKTEPDLIRQFLDDLGRRLNRETTIYVAGAGALILPGYLQRHTEDIDVVDEVPKEIRDNHRLVQELQDSYGLHLGHVQSHYFPMGFQSRVQSLDRFGRLHVFLVDVHDIFLSKLFSRRVKDMGDLRLLAPQLSKAALVERLQRSCNSFLAAPRLRQIAQDNWHVLFGEDLPS